MVIKKNLIEKNALISVYDKDNLGMLCNKLYNFKYNLLATGTTCKCIRDLGFKCKEVKDITKFSEILEGRLKTLHPNIHAPILYKRDDILQKKQFEKMRLPSINIVIINLYPFHQFSKKFSDEEKIIDMIDIGGPALMRSASKNYKFVTIVPNKFLYKNFFKNLEKNNGVTDISFRQKMAQKSFEITSRYDDLINKWFLSKTLQKKSYKKLRYGENPNQKSKIINNKNNIFKYQLSGKEISYNNILDVDSGISLINEFTEPTCVIIKHTNACAVASNKLIEKAFINAYNADSKSAFGGIIIFNRSISKKLSIIIKKYFFEVIVAPKISKVSLEIFKTNTKVILLEIDRLKKERETFRSTRFGILTQKSDNDKISKKFFKLVTKNHVSKQNYDDLIFAARVVKHLKSNAIALSKNKQTVGLGIGQTNRLEAVKLAVRNFKKNKKYKDFVCASDGFFPFSDSVKFLVKNSCRAIVQPMGSKNDQIVIDTGNTNNLPIYSMKYRLFKH